MNEQEIDILGGIPISGKQNTICIVSHNYFAWRPVKTYNAGWQWLRNVRRKKFVTPVTAWCAEPGKVTFVTERWEYAVSK